MATEKRLIDANELTDRLSHTTMVAYPNLFPGLLAAVEVVDDTPTVDAVEVVHGRWISKGRKLECSVCEHRAFLGTTDPVIHREEKNIRKYCHNCGAKMDGEARSEARSEA